MVFAGIDWQPSEILRVARVLETSTKPVLVSTDVGLAIVKYLGNPAGNEALIGEIVGCSVARLLGLKTPDFAIMAIPAIDLPEYPLVQVQAGLAFFSRWEEMATSLSPNSSLLEKLRRPEDIAKLVVLDTWLRNKDRFAGDEGAAFDIVNYDNVLLKPDKRMVELLAIDHSHALVETTLDDELGKDWVEEQVVYGRFSQFDKFLTRKMVGAALAAVERIDRVTLRRVCEDVPRAWGMTAALSERLFSCLDDRARRLRHWLPAALFDQYELELEQGEAADE
ncbi:HipA family kinase [Pannonibacter phragmitetus]|uniref:HipA family kinase n=1 Tax=Pannonibacter phragmitetus TaxID=121719 RepID=UPI000F03FEE0|nr:HipA family kinase [Pannonibacter phragmitetus]MBA4207284.1 hypothetical protein [Polymorphum sp.]